jgi:hypothetical protein
MSAQELPKDGEGLVAHVRIWVVLKYLDHPWNNVCSANLASTASLAGQPVESNLTNRSNGVIKRGKKRRSGFVRRMMVQEVEAPTPSPRIFMVKRGPLNLSQRPAAP